MFSRSVEKEFWKINWLFYPPSESLSRTRFGRARGRRLFPAVVMPIPIAIGRGILLRRLYPKATNHGC
jgi:hypothetical protein